MKMDYRVTPFSKKELLRVYTDVAPEHFPQNELKPVSAIYSLLERKAYIGLGLYEMETEHLVGYALFLKIPERRVLLLDYYAVFPEYRSKGMGSIFLQKIKNFFADVDGILLETEAPEAAKELAEKEIRDRRNKFYFRGGARMTSFSCSLFGVAFHILYLPIERNLEDHILRKELEMIYRFMLPRESYGANVVWN